jgi:hypothetical protein
MFHENNGSTVFIMFIIPTSQQVILVDKFNDAFVFTIVFRKRNFKIVLQKNKFQLFCRNARHWHRARRMFSKPSSMAIIPTITIAHFVRARFSGFTIRYSQVHLFCGFRRNRFIIQRIGARKTTYKKKTFKKIDFYSVWIFH